jgi:hypothetical protein
MDEDRITSFWYDTSLEWGVTVAEASDENVVCSIVAAMFEDDVPF